MHPQAYGFYWGGKGDKVQFVRSNTMEIFDTQNEVADITPYDKETIDGAKEFKITFVNPLDAAIKLKQCKQCITMHVNNFDPDTYLWILQECDVPYVPEEWNKLLLSYGQDRSKLTGMTILGRYLSKMKLKQYKDYRWEHNQHLQDIANKKIEETMLRQGYDRVQIDEAINKATITLPEGEIAEPVYAAPALPVDETEDYFATQAGAADDFVDDLTDEDRTYLRLKWGKTYKPEEWIRLEQLYEEMMASYDIQGAGHIDTLKLVCKTSLKANQLIDIGDIEGFQKMQKAYDSLMKAGKFTAAQNKAESGEYVDSISELVELCEKQGYIERFYVDDPNDKVDATIKDMQRYTKTLIEEETNLSNLIEQAIKQNLKEDESATEDSDEIIFDDIDEVERELSDEDFAEFSDFVSDDAEADQDLLHLLEGDQ